MTTSKKKSTHLNVVQVTELHPMTNEAQINKRVPVAEWVANPSGWSIEKYIEEISQYLLDTYGIIEPHHRHAIALLAGHIDTYIKCTVAIKDEGLLTEYHDGTSLGVNKHMAIRLKIMPVIISLMNELGLTPKSKFTPKSNANNNTLAKILKGPKAT